MKTLPSAPTPAELAKRLEAPSGSKDRFGGTATQVLGTCGLIAAASASWDKGTIRSFQEQEGLNPKVWDKLIAIARSENLQGLPEGSLPASYTALYALVVMSDEELAAAVQEGLLERKEGQGPISSRSILDWTKAYRLRGTGIEQEVPLTLVIQEDLTAEQQQDLLSALQETAARFGAQVLEGKGGVKQAEVKAEARRAKASEIEEELMREIAAVVLNAPEDLKTRFGISNAGDLVGAPRGTFTGFFQNLEGKVEGAFWRQHGRAYCLRIARDYNLTESRAERYQLKKRIDDAIEKWSEKIDGFQAMAEGILKTYMGR